MTLSAFMVPKASAILLGEPLAATVVALTSATSEDPLAAFAHAFGLDGEAAKSRLRADDLRLRELADLSLISGKDDFLFHGVDEPPKVSDSLKALTDGRIAFDVVMPTSSDVLDPGTEAWLGLVIAAPETQQGCNVLYRVGGAEPEAMPGSLRVAARRLTHRIGDGSAHGLTVPVFLARVRDVRMSSAAALVVMAAAMHVEGQAIIVVGSQELMFGKSEVSDDEYFGPEAEAPKESSSGSALRTLCTPLFEAAAHVHIWAAPIDAVLQTGSPHPFAIAFGPADLDMRSALDELRRMAPASFDDRTLTTVLGTFGSPEASRRIIACALRIADHLPDTAAAIAVRLASSLRMHVSKPMSARADVEFDIGLVNADCDITRLLSRANHLGRAGAGARILLHGVPGGGKSILAAALARAMGRRVRSVRGGDVFFSKWGATERAIWSILEDARRKGEIVVLEEAESIVGNRSDRASDSNRHLTTTATNEWLAALDEHSDPVLATTNSVNDVDPAMRRRFHLLIELLPLLPDQEPYAWKRILGVEPPPGWIHAGESVVADFTTAATRMRLFGDSGSASAGLALHAAIAARSGLASMPMRIGFPITRDHALDDLPSKHSDRDRVIHSGRRP